MTDVPILAQVAAKRAAMASPVAFQPPSTLASKPDGLEAENAELKRQVSKEANE